MKDRGNECTAKHRKKRRREREKEKKERKEREGEREESCWNWKAYGRVQWRATDVFEKNGLAIGRAGQLDVEKFVQTTGTQHSGVNHVCRDTSSVRKKKGKDEMR